MSHNEETAEQLLGSVVTGTKPWNNLYNVGLVVAKSQTEENSAAIKIMWMHPKIQAGYNYDTALIPEGKYLYTWEHPTSVSVLSRNEYHG